jgi:hypothetical protein
MNIQAQITFTAPSLSEFIAALQAVQALGITPSPSVAPAPVTRGASQKKEKHPLEILYNEKTGEKFTVSGADCQAVGWEGKRGEIPENLRLSAIAGRLASLGVPVTDIEQAIASGETESEAPAEVQEMPEISPDEIEGAGF